MVKARPVIEEDSVIGYRPCPLTAYGCTKQLPLGQASPSRECLGYGLFNTAVITQWQPPNDKCSTEPL